MVLRVPIVDQRPARPELVERRLRSVLPVEPKYSRPTDVERGDADALAESLTLAGVHADHGEGWR